MCVCIGSLHVGPQFSMGSSFYLPSPWTPATVLTLDVLRDFYPGLTLHCHCPFFESQGDVLMVSVSQVKLNHLTQLDCIFVQHLYMVPWDRVSSLVSVLLLDAEVKM